MKINYSEQQIDEFFKELNLSGYDSFMKFLEFLEIETSNQKSVLAVKSLKTASISIKIDNELTNKLNEKYKSIINDVELLMY